MSSLFRILFCLLSLLAIALCEEPQCSRFHYEEQTLLKLVKLELKMEHIEKELIKMDNIEREIFKVEQIERKLTKIEEKVKKKESKTVLTLQSIYDYVQSLLNSQKLSHYVRWGGEDCPGNGTSMLYKGYMAGKHWSTFGSGTNSLCLPEVPSWAEHIDGYQNGAKIYGTQIEIDGTLSSKMFGSNVHNHDMSCTMCTSERASVAMFPGFSKCLAGWTKEYQGYLVASHPSHKGSSDFVCLDADFVKDRHRGNSEHVIRPVEVQCGIIPCPPYVDGREVACVVCSK